MNVAPRKLPPPRRLGEFIQVQNPTNRLNPQSLRKALYDLTKQLFGTDLSAAAVSLKNALRTRFGRNLRVGISDEILYNIICGDKTHLKYAHLEAYARYMGIPVSLILFYSRLFANQQDQTPRENLVMLNAFAKIIRDAQLKYDNTKKNVYNIDDLIRWAAIYRAEDNEPSLFPLREL